LTRILRFSAAILICLAVAGQQAVQQARIDHDEEVALAHITADSLRGHLSFLSSDLLEGRDTPSRGLDIAAEYIAAQFRRVGLEAPVNGDYFQNADLMLSERDMKRFEFRVTAGDRSFAINNQDVAIPDPAQLRISRAPLFKMDWPQAKEKGVTPEQLKGAVLLVEFKPDQMTGFRKRLNELQPALAVFVDRSGLMSQGAAGRKLRYPEERPAAVKVPGIFVGDPELVKEFDRLKPGLSADFANVRWPAPKETSVRARNVIGVLRGSDPELKDTYVMLTAHYDHLGVKPGGSGDRIYNGANDDGSGVVSVIQVASALAGLEHRPRRSIAFMTFFGEEEGLLGSQYYARHPVLPLDKTVADVNLEQVGRTDATDGKQVGSATFTGFRFSDLPKVFQTAGELTGVRVYDTPQSPDFFARSDNLAFAEKGVPAHTLAVAYDYPDYHRVTDSWDKIDYDNLAKVDRMIALGVILLANSGEAPKWNEPESGAAPYLKAWRALHPGPH
jgi:hypothetical protein